MTFSRTAPLHDWRVTLPQVPFGHGAYRASLWTAPDAPLLVCGPARLPALQQLAAHLARRDPVLLIRGTGTGRTRLTSLPGGADVLTLGRADLALPRAERLDAAVARLAWADRQGHRFVLMDDRASHEALLSVRTGARLVLSADADLSGDARPALETSDGPEALLGERYPAYHEWQALYGRLALLWIARGHGPGLQLWTASDPLHTSVSAAPGRGSLQA